MRSHHGRSLFTRSCLLRNSHVLEKEVVLFKFTKFFKSFPNNITILAAIFERLKTNYKLKRSSRAKEMKVIVFRRQGVLPRFLKVLLIMNEKQLQRTPAIVGLGQGLYVFVFLSFSF